MSKRTRIVPSLDGLVDWYHKGERSSNPEIAPEADRGFDEDSGLRVLSPKQYASEGIASFFERNPYAVDIGKGRENYWRRLKFVCRYSRAKHPKRREQFEATLEQRSAELQEAGFGTMWVDIYLPEEISEFFKIDNLKKHEHSRVFYLKKTAYLTLFLGGVGVVDGLIDGGSLGQVMESSIWTLPLALPFAYYAAKVAFDPVKERIRQLKRNCKGATECVREAYKIYDKNIQKINYRPY